MRSWWALTFLLLCGVDSALAGPQSGRVDLDWLQTIAFAAHQTNYSGTFIYQYGNHVETSSITHVSGQNGEQERVESLDGPHREIIRDNDAVWCSTEGRKPVRLANHHKNRSFPALLPEQISALKKNYRISIGHKARVAGFMTQSIVFHPRDNLRYTHKFWAQLDSGLLLKAAVLDEHGRTVEQYAFTEVKIGGDIKPDWAIPNASQPSAAQPVNLPRQPRASELVDSSAWKIDDLPPGFRKIMSMKRPMHGKKSPVLHMVYSDGLAGISVFIEKVDGDDDDLHPSLTSQGAIQIYSKLLDDGHLVTVVGEVPPRTVMQVADSVRYAGD